MSGYMYITFSAVHYTHASKIERAKKLKTTEKQFQSFLNGIMAKGYNLVFNIVQ